MKKTGSEAKITISEDFMSLNRYFRKARIALYRTPDKNINRCVMYTSENGCLKHAMSYLYCKGEG